MSDRWYKALIGSNPHKLYLINPIKSNLIVSDQSWSDTVRCWCMCMKCALQIKFEFEFIYRTAIIDLTTYRRGEQTANILSHYTDVAE